MLYTYSYKHVGSERSANKDYTITTYLHIAKISNWLSTGCLTSAAQVLLGVQAGATVLLQRSHKARVSRWLAWALVFALAGGLLTGFSREHGVLPINKNLWYGPRKNQRGSTRLDLSTPDNLTGECMFISQGSSKWLMQHSVDKIPLQPGS